MMATAAGAVVAIALGLYAVTGGADFGGGVWDLLASGPRKQAQRDAIAREIAPIWEANHVWLILVVVVLFVAFPPVFAAVSIALHIPLTLMLIGIVLRGAAFVFRAYDPAGGAGWGRVFSMASAVTPVFLGICLGAAVQGFRVDKVGFVAAWWQPFPVLLGLFVLALFSLLAATYLAVATDGDLRQDFRRRALGAGLATGVLAFATLAVSPLSLPLPLHLVTGGASVGALVALATGRIRLARVLVVAQALLVVGGWALHQYPMALRPDWTLQDAAAPPSVLGPMLTALAVGSPVLLGAFAWLYKVFSLRSETS